MSMLPRAILSAVTLLALAIPASSAPDRPAPDGFFRYPSIAGDTVVFASEGDLWKVPLSGGAAQRLTAHEGVEGFPRLSPDGKWIAFTAAYQGNPDVYVMASAGGEPRRLTVHPFNDLVLGWTEDGDVLFRSRRDTPHGDWRVHRVDPEGGASTLVPLEPAAWISFEPGGKRVAFQKMGLETHNWKRYRGGEAEDIEVGTLEPLAFTNVTGSHDGKDAFPMWSSDGRIYFVSDRWGRPNLASMAPDGSDVVQLTRFQDYDVRWPTMGSGKIVFQHAMDLWVFDVATRDSRKIDVVLPSDRLQTRERQVDPMASRGRWGLSKDGARIVLETRGDLFVTRTRKKGLIRRLTASSAARTKDPAFSPDGKRVAAWSEVEGEEQLVLFPADNAGERRQLGTIEPGWHFPPAWSPDGSRLAWSDEKLRLQVTDVASGTSRVVDTSRWEIADYVWSPDSRHLAYSVMQPNGYGLVRVWDGSRTHDVSDGAWHTFSPAWDPEGAWLYYLSDRTFNPRLDNFGDRFVIKDATRPYVVALKAAGKLPFGARSDLDPDGKEDEKKDDASKGKEGKEEADGDAKEKPPKPIVADWEGIADRLVEVPVPPGSYGGLSAVAGKLHFVRYEDRGLFPDGGEDEGPPVATLLTYDIEAEKLATVTDGVMGYELSMDRKVLVYQTKDGYVRMEAGGTSAPKGDPASPEGGDDGKIDLSGWSMSVDPRDEWRQILREAWRLQRDFFYDPAMHGVDWNAVWAQYGPLADRIASRDDLADLLGEMLGELSVGHAYHWGGDVRTAKAVPTGLLAADLTQDAKSGFWRIDKVYRGDWPDASNASPLARPDLRVTAGSWLVAIDGKPLVPGEDYLRRLVGRAGTEVELSINATPALAGARRIVVKPVASDQPARYATWVRECRARVDKASGGKIGYLHLYDMGGMGLHQFARDIESQWDKQGLVIDDRWNHGGFVAPLIVAHLDRKIFSVGGTRHGVLYTTPDRRFGGHMAVLINRQGGSDCETLALEMKSFGLAPIIGTRTWGGWVGIRGDKTFRDGGTSTQPEFSGWDPTGKSWLIEGHGVDPDVVLDLGPDGLLRGNDVQLDYAVEDLMKRIAADPRTLPPAPPIPPRPLKPVPEPPRAAS